MKARNQSLLYEQEATLAVTGETIRPGRFKLTKRIVHECALLPGMSVIDIGCGMGSTVEYLQTQHKLNSLGIDSSFNLISRGKATHCSLPLIVGYGELLPFRNSIVDGILMECSLSLMNDADMVLSESYRTLRQNGWLAITDIFLKGKLPTQTSKVSSMFSCINGARRQEDIIKAISRHGFQVVLWEDHTALLRQLVVDIIWHHGSLKNFWATMLPKACDCSYYKILKPGYYLCIARKTSK